MDEKLYHYTLRNQLSIKNRKFCGKCFSENNCKIPSKEPILLLSDYKYRNYCPKHAIEVLKKLRKIKEANLKEITKDIEEIDNMINKCNEVIDLNI